MITHSTKDIILYYNPISGKGSSKKRALALSHSLKEQGFNPQLLESEKKVNTQKIAAEFALAEAILVLGGDGTMMKLLDALAISQTPVYMLPMGVESLFCKEFGMKDSDEKIIAALNKKESLIQYFGKIDVGNTDSSFFTMASIGLDSQIVANISKNRSSAIGRIGYVLPTLKAIVQHKPATISLALDGESVISKKTGYLLIANTKQYALNLNYLSEASPNTQKLYARFYPYRSIWPFLLHSLTRLLGSKGAPKNSSYFEGDYFEVSTSSPYPIQADGDALGETPVNICCAKKSIKVLCSP